MNLPLYIAMLMVLLFVAILCVNYLSASINRGRVITLAPYPPRRDDPLSHEVLRHET